MAFNTEQLSRGCNRATERKWGWGCRDARGSSPRLTLDLCEVTNTYGATHSCVEVPADLQVGMVGVWPGNKKTTVSCEAGEVEDERLTGINGFWETKSKHGWRRRWRWWTVNSSVKEGYLQCSSSELEKASNSSPMLIITVLVSGHTWHTSSTHIKATVDNSTTFSWLSLTKWECFNDLKIFFPPGLLMCLSSK